MRLTIPVIWGPFFECLCFGFLGLWLRSESPKTKRWILVWLAFVSSVGFYTWINWAGFWMGLTGVLILKSCLGVKRNPRQLLPFFTISFLLILPLLQSRLSPGGATHIHDSLNFSILKPLAQYGTGVFWNGFLSFPYGSNWGGFFNPILSSLVFLGFIFLLRETFAGLFGGIMLCLLGAALPGILTNSVELSRVLLTFPLFTILAAMGAYGLMAEECRNWRLMLVFLLMVGSMSLDINNFANHYCNTRIIPPDRQWRNVEYFDAYNILRDFSRKEGPLYIFSTFK